MPKEFKSFYKNVGGGNEAYEYWRKNFNPNPADCCNLRIGADKEEKTIQDPSP